MRPEQTIKLKLTEQPMNGAIHKLTLLFLGVFVASCVAVAVYQLVWVMPQKRCEDREGWWDPQTRLCGTPIFLPNLTHRPIGAPKITPNAR
jgi:hypothetical protein